MSKEQELWNRLNAMELSNHAREVINQSDAGAAMNLFGDCETAEDVEAVAKEICVNWYAVVMDKEDNDWGYGSYNLDKAKKMVLDRLDVYPEAYILVIEEGSDPICVDEIHQEDF